MTQDSTSNVTIGETRMWSWKDAVKNIFKASAGDCPFDSTCEPNTFDARADHPSIPYHLLCEASGNAYIAPYHLKRIVEARLNIQLYCLVLLALTPQHGDFIGLHQS